MAIKKVGALNSPYSKNGPFLTSWIPPWKKNETNNEYNKGANKGNFERPYYLCIKLKIWL
jgi:hypothetical protein